VIAIFTLFRYYKVKILNNKHTVIQATVKTANELQQRDQELIQLHQDYILQLAQKNNNPVAI